MRIPHRVRINLPLVVGRPTSSAQRGAAILRFWEVAYRVQIELSELLVGARRRLERRVISDMLLRVGDPMICTTLYQRAFTQETRDDMIMNVNEMQAIASRDDTRGPVRDACKVAIGRMIRAYEDLAYEM